MRKGGPDGRRYTTANFERDIRMPDRTEAIAADLWSVLGKYGLQDEKTIVFCVDDTHAAFMAQELRKLAGNPDFVARITRSERNSHQLERNFAVVGASNPRIAVTVDLLSTGFDAPDVKNIVFARPLRSAILYKQMKGRGTRICEDNNKRYVCLADGRKVPFDEYTRQSREFILDVTDKGLDKLLAIWIDKKSRRELREELRDHDIYTSAFRHYLDLPETDDVDILAKIGFQLPLVPTRRDRANRLWDQDQPWLLDHLGKL